MKPRTMFEKIWEAHLVRPASPDTPAILYVDLHLVHEVTSPQAFTWLRERDLKVRRPERTVATMDHSTPTTPRGRDGKIPVLDNAAALQIAALEKNCADFGIELHALGSDGQGIVHVIGPERGLTQPGAVIVCGDSHTSTHGAFGALAFGIGTSEVSHVLATQSLLQNPPKTLAVTVEGKLRPGRHREGRRARDHRPPRHRRRHRARDRVPRLGDPRAHDGRADDRLQHVDRGGRARRHDRPRRDDVRVPQGAAARAAGRGLGRGGRGLEGAAVGRGRGVRSRGEVRRGHARADDHLRHQPGDGDPDRRKGARAGQRDRREGARLHGARGEAAAARAQDRRRVHRQLHELAAVATCARRPAIFKGRKVADGVRVLVVPGSQAIKLAAEAEGLDRVFREAGAEWREAGCSMCIAMNGDQLRPGQYAVSTSNRNFEGRQGAGGRTFLASPLTAAAAAVTGRITDARELAQGARLMEKITTITSRTVVLPVENVDTDQIIPARFLKATSKAGLGEKLFADWRLDGDGKAKPDFVLNRPEAKGAAVLVAGDNFGCGSSREHAPWALYDYGFRAVVSHVDRRHLPQQRAQERPPAGGRGSVGARQAAWPRRAPR